MQTQLLKNATVIDAWSGKARPHHSILIRNAHIVAIGPVDEIGEPDGADVLDCTGRWIIPGLIDMHCHIKDIYAPYFVSAGVTTVRNTAGSLRELNRLRTAPADAPTPRVISSGRLIDGSPGMWPGGNTPGTCLTDTVEEGIAEVRAQVAEGTDLIKVYSLLKPEVARAIAEEAAAHGVQSSCDITDATAWDIRSAARFGYRWSEHASGFVQALYPQYRFRDPSTHTGIPMTEPDSPELDALCREVADRGLMLCPTMVLIQQAYHAQDPWWPEFVTVPALKEYFAYWNDMVAHPGIQKIGTFTHFNQAIARAFRRAGGVVVAGTDVPAGVFVAPGIALHRELQILVANGWSPTEAIQAATSVPAAAMGRRDLGAIRPGAVADLVVLTADPLADIRNTLAIEQIVKGGRLFRPEEPQQYCISMDEHKQRYEQLLADFARDGR